MNFFEEATLRLKQQLHVKADKDAAKELGLSAVAWVGRKKRGNFPEKELYALAAKRPELALDVDYVLTGVTGEARGRLDALQAKIERAGDAGLNAAELDAFTHAHGPGPTSARLAQLQTMLARLRVVEFDGLYEVVQSIVTLRDALEAQAKAGPEPEAAPAKKKRRGRAA